MKFLVSPWYLAGLFVGILLAYWVLQAGSGPPISCTIRDRDPGDMRVIAPMDRATVGNPPGSDGQRAVLL